jgi:pimeloyl-ACP methyl ester carboxylesterase
MDRDTSTRRLFLKLAAAASVGASAVTAEAGAAFRLARWGGPPAHFVLVHGAWHGAWCWYKVAPALERVGQGVSVLDLPAGGIDATAPRDVTLAAQVDRVLAVLDALPAPVILVGHSAGGAVISAVAEARPERIAKLVYLSAFLLQSGNSVVQESSRDTTSLLTGRLLIRLDQSSVEVDPAVRRDAFYNRSSDQDDALAATLLKPVGLLPLATPLALGANFASVRRFYVSCLRDQAVTPAAQERMYTALPCERVFTLRDSDHSPFFSRPRELLRILREIARA